MIKHIFFILFFLISLTLNVGATCEDKPGDSVDYSGCQFADGQDLSASYLTNSNLSLTSFNKVNFDRSMMMHSNLSNGNFAESTFFRTNLYESVLVGGNFEGSNFESANLTRVKFNGASLIGASFKNSNLVEADFTAANILNANFEGANLNNAIWADGAKCSLGSIGLCKKNRINAIFKAISLAKK